jgi:molybdopterin-binding protein
MVATSSGAKSSGRQFYFIQVMVDACYAIIKATSVMVGVD